MQTKTRPTAVEYAKEFGVAISWSALIDNRDSEPVTGMGYRYQGWPGHEGTRHDGVVIRGARRFANAKESLYLIQDGRSGSTMAYRVAGWLASEDAMILHSVTPAEPLGPRRVYHLVASR